MAAAAPTMPHVWTVSELTAAVRRALEGQFPVVDLEGEITGFKRYPSGHAYFTIKDSVSQISAVMFKGFFDACAARDGFKDGAKLKVRGKVTIGTRSQYQFIVQRARLLGEGELMQRYLELKAKLAAEGLFDTARKRPLPFLPHRIGLVTSPAGAVVHDLCRVLMRRFPALEIRLYPAVVQGASAPASVLAGIDWFNRAPDGWRADLIIFGRGGGSFEDLYCFNDERLVRAVAASQVPTISAVGHETDFTLCDFAADLRAGTPSMAAELAVPEREKLVRRIDDAQATLVATLRGKYEWYAQKVDGLSDDLPRALAAPAVAAAHQINAAVVVRHARIDNRTPCLSAIMRIAAIQRLVVAAHQTGNIRRTALPKTWLDDAQLAITNFISRIHIWFHKKRASCPCSSVIVAYINERIPWTTFD